MESTMIKEGLEKILGGYYKARNDDPFEKGHHLFSVFTSLKDILGRGIANKFPNIKVTWSMGQGNWAKVPWIAFLDTRETDTTQHGVYCVFLFRQDMSGVYLTYNQGVTEPKRRLGGVKARDFLRSHAEKVREQCSDIKNQGFMIDDQIDLRADSGLGSDYEDSTIAYKFYKTGDVPSDREIIQDLEAVLQAYENYIKSKMKESPVRPRAWIFQTNPKYYDLVGAIPELTEVTWVTRQHRESIHVGHKVYLWQSGKDSGLVAVATVLTEPAVLAEDEVEQRFLIKKEKFTSVEPRVRLHIDQVLPERIKRQIFLDHPVLGNMSILKAPEGTNFALTDEQAGAIAGLIYEIDITPPKVDLSAIHTSFSSALKASHITFGSQHEDLTRAFIASLVTKRFVILTGLSGSGKTQIAIKFGEWLGVGRLLVVPVRPDWTGSEAIFGYEDALLPALDGRRAWHVPDILRFMLQAARDPKNPYLIVLDEMNLAHIERYFADVLSGMESMKECLKNLRLEEDGFCRSVPGEADKILFPRNLFIVGTVNVDETTYMFSPKVLDRANTLEFRVNTDDLTTDMRKPIPCEPGALMLVRGLLAIAMDENWHLENPSSNIKLFTDHLRDLHSLLAKGGFEFGHRVFYEAVRFAAIYEATGDRDPEHALDLQVMQKVLPRLHGSRRRLEPTLCALARFCFDLTQDLAADFGESGNRFDPKTKLSGDLKLPRAFDKVVRMIRSLRANQFVSFNE